MKIDKRMLFKVARVVRGCAEYMVKTGDYGRISPHDKPENLGGSCGDVSYVLGQLTGLCNCFEAGSYDGWGHCWIRLPDGEIWDLTATQFKVPARIHVVKQTASEKYVTAQRGKRAIEGLKAWADHQWRKRLRDLARAELKKEGVIL